MKLINTFINDELFNDLCFIAISVVPWWPVIGGMVTLVALVAWIGSLVALVFCFHWSYWHRHSFLLKLLLEPRYVSGNYCILYYAYYSVHQYHHTLNHITVITVDCHFTSKIEP